MHRSDFTKRTIRAAVRRLGYAPRHAFGPYVPRHA